MAEIALYAKDKRLVTEAGALLPTNARPIVRWREQDTFTLRLADGGEFPEGAYHYAFDIDRDFLETEPCNTGECEIVDGALVFTVTFGSVRQAQATNNRRHPVAFYMQVTRDGHDYAEYVVEDAIWADGCVWDGRIPPAPEAPNYYTKAEVDGIADGKLDAPAEAGEPGYVLGLAEDGSTAWIPQSGGGGREWGTITGDIENQTDLMGKLEDKANLKNGKLNPAEMPVVNWNDVQSKPTFSKVATSGNYADLSNKPAIPTSLSDLDSDPSHRTVTDEDKAAWDDKSDFSGSYNDLTDKPSIPPAQVQSDWTEMNTGSKAYVKNKPTLATVAMSGSYNDLNNKPTIPPAQVQADWNETSTSSKAYINNKPVVANAATNAQIDSRSASQDIRPSNLEYAVRSVMPNVTTIPAATTAYTLLDASATTNNHSAHYTHAPTGIPTYTLPAVTNAAIAHEILLDVDFTTVQACGFVDSQGAEIPLQSDISIAAVDKWRFICVYSLDDWRVYPLPIEVADGGGGGVPDTLVVSGTEADTYVGTYSLTSDTMNDRPIWSNASNGKNIWAIQNGMDAGWYAWVVGGTPVAQAAGDTPMFYDFCTMDVDGLAALSASPDQSTKSWMHNMSPVQDTQFSVTEG